MNCWNYFSFVDLNLTDTCMAYSMAYQTYGWYTYDVHENCLIFKILHPLVYLGLKFFHPLDHGHQTKPPLQMITNQFKENIIQRWLSYVIRSFRSVFIFNINSLILSGFPLTSFYLVEALLSVFPWLYTLVCVVVQKYYKMSFIYIYSHF